MSRDNWERLVTAVLRREQLWQLFHEQSRSTTSISSSDDLTDNFSHTILNEADLSKPVKLTDQVIKAADDARLFKQKCAELKSKAEKLAGLLRQAVLASNDLYKRRIIDDVEQVLEKALALLLKCSGHRLKDRVFTIIPVSSFRKMLSQLENSIRDVSWLHGVSASVNDRADEYLGLPSIID